jgi:uncharacterized membrane protein
MIGRRFPTRDISPMPLTYLALKYLHVVGATLLLGTGAGIAFFMAMAHRSGDAAFIARTAGVVILADTIFTLTAIVAQPVTGYALMTADGLTMNTGWINAAVILYVVAGLFWLPVVWMQIRMRDFAEEAVRAHAELPAAYHRLFRLWFVFGFPAFGAVLLIIWLMIAKPQF